MFRLCLVGVTLLTALVSAAGCRQLGVPCVAAEDCGAAEVCVSGACVVACNVDDDCDGSDVCVDGLCAAEGEGEEGEGEEGEGEEGEGEGEEGEGEGEEGEGEEGEGEGEEGEGEGEAGEGEGEGDVDRCDGKDPFGADLNGDCVPDLVVGAPAAGRVAFIEGKPDGNVLGDGNLDWGRVVVGNAGAGSAFGASIAFEPDVDDDVGSRGVFAGVPGDAQVRALRFEPIDGVNFQDVFPGTVDGEANSNFGKLLLVSKKRVDGSVDLLSFDDGDGGRLVLDTADVGPFADDVVFASGAGVRALLRTFDVDEDGVDDFLVGQPNRVVGPGEVGVYALSGASLAELALTFAMPADAADSFGSALVDVGDWDGDGKHDVAIGAPDDGRAGSVRVWLTTRATDDLITIEPPAIVTDAARWGLTLMPLVDVDGDKKLDIGVGAPLDDSGNGADDPVCDTFSPRAYTGDCIGGLYVAPSTRVLGAQAPEVAFPCVFGSRNHARATTGLRALGPHPELTAAQQIAVGLPSALATEIGVAAVLVFTVNLAGGVCTTQAALGVDFAADDLFTTTGGDQFGSTFGL